MSKHIVDKAKDIAIDITKGAKKIYRIGKSKVKKGLDNYITYSKHKANKEDDQVRQKQRDLRQESANFDLYHNNSKLKLHKNGSKI